MINLSNYIDKAIGLLMGYGPKLLLAILTLIIGLWIIKLVMKAFGRTMELSKIDISLQKFFKWVSSLLNQQADKLLNSKDYFPTFSTKHGVYKSAYISGYYLNIG
jgi:uncharacterized membrane protein (Fun14 family)